MKYEWRKKEKDTYLPKTQPEIIIVPTFKYFSIKGKGNPNSPFFRKCIEALYSLSYTIRMSYKNGFEPDDFFEFTVYPLEGIWDISEEAKEQFNGKLDKDSLVFHLMIRQPDFVTKDLAKKAFELAKKKKANDLIDEVIFSRINEGRCVQMMHLGSYDNEPKTFKIMEDFCSKNNLIRESKTHKEIYISDPRKVKPERLKTVLRFKIKT